MKATKEINIYLTKKRNVRQIDVVQYDTGIQLVFTVMDLDIPSGATATMYVQKPSGKFVYQEDGITVADNTITIDLDNQAITEHGKVPYQVSLTSGSDVITTFTGLMLVEKSLKDSGATESKTVIRAFDEAVADHVAEFQTKAEQIVQACIATLPDDYTTMEAKVNELANAIKGNLSGAVVVADDVSPVEHSPVVKIHGKNLFNYAAWKGITIRNGTATFTDAGAVTLTANANDCYTLYSESDFPESVRIKVTPGEQITLSWNVDDADASGSVYIFPNGATADFGMAWSAQKMLVYTVPRGCEFITFRLGVAYAGDTITYRNIQLERGGTATDYEAYIAPTAVTVKRYGKNLCPSIAVGKSGTTGGVTFTGLKGGGIGVSGTPTDLGRYSIYNGVALTKAGYITLSLSGNFTNIVWDFQLKNANKTIIKQIQTGTSATLNLDDYPDTVYWDIGIKRYENGVVCGGTVYVQVEAGLTATDFEAYQSPTTHTPESDGSISDMTSLSPSMTILTDTDGAIVECEYNRDTNKVIDKIITALGGAI